MHISSEEDPQAQPHSALTYSLWWLRDVAVGDGKAFAATSQIGFEAAHAQVEIEKERPLGMCEEGFMAQSRKANLVSWATTED